MPCENLKLSVHLACASHDSGSGEDPINTLDAFAGRLDFLHESPGLAFLCKLPHSITGKLIMLPDVVVRAVCHSYEQKARERILLQQVLVIGYKAPKSIYVYSMSAN